MYYARFTNPKVLYAPQSKSFALRKAQSRPSNYRRIPLLYKMRRERNLRPNIELVVYSFVER